jgi:hypothetical protein
VVRINPDGSFLPGVTNFAITPAMNPMMIVQMMCMAISLGIARPVRVRTIFASDPH